MNGIECANIFLKYLKRKYPLHIKVKVNFHDVSELYLKDEEIWAGGCITKTTKGVSIDIATGGFLAEILQSIAHEHKHCLQLQDGTWTEKGFASFESEMEVEARDFAARVMIEWKAHCKKVEAKPEEKAVAALVVKEELKAADLMIEKYREFREAHPDCDLSDELASLGINDPSL